MRTLSAHEVARAFGVSPAAVLKWIRKGWLQGARPARKGLPWRIRRSAVRRMLMERPRLAARATLIVL